MISIERDHTDCVIRRQESATPTSHVVCLEEYEYVYAGKVSPREKCIMEYVYSVRWDLVSDKAKVGKQHEQHPEAHRGVRETWEQGLQHALGGRRCS